MMLACHVGQKGVSPRSTDQRRARSAKTARKTTRDGIIHASCARPSASPRSLKLTRQSRSTIAPALKRKPIHVAFERKGDEDGFTVAATERPLSHATIEKIMVRSSARCGHDPTHPRWIAWGDLVAF